MWNCPAGPRGQVCFPVGQLVVTLGQRTGSGQSLDSFLHRFDHESVCSRSRIGSLPANLHGRSSHCEVPHTPPSSARLAKSRWSQPLPRVRPARPGAHKPHNATRRRSVDDRKTHVRGPIEAGMIPAGAPRNGQNRGCLRPDRTGIREARSDMTTSAARARTTPPSRLVISP